MWRPSAVSLDDANLAAVQVLVSEAAAAFAEAAAAGDLERAEAWARLVLSMSQEAWVDA